MCMLKLTILQQMLVVSIALSTITCALVQKTKKMFKVFFMFMSL